MGLNSLQEEKQKVILYEKFFSEQIFSFGACDFMSVRAGFG